MNFPFEQILYRITQGDEAAFQQLYTYLRLPAMTFCATLIKDEEQAEIALEETFAKIWDQRQQINPRQNFQAFLFTCLRDQVFGQLRKAQQNSATLEHFMSRMQAPA